MKKVLSCTIVLFIVSVSLAVPVNIPDPALKVAIENVLGPNPEPADMLLLTTLTANSLGITDLTGLEYATNLQTLSLQNNNISNLGPLSGLTKLENLYLQRNPNLSSIGSLSGLIKMKYFKITDCNIADIGVVTNFTLLQALSAGDSHSPSFACDEAAYPGNNNISSLASLTGRTTLRYLYIYGNNISDLTPLATIPELRELDVANNNITNLNALSGLTKLEFLNLRCNNISDINSLGNLTKLIYLFASYNGNILDVNAVGDMNSLAELGLTDVNLADISPLVDVNQIKVLWLGYNQIADINALTKYDKLTQLDLTGNPLSFQSWCPYLRQIGDNNPAAQIDTMPLFGSLIYYGETDAFDLQIFHNRWLDTGCNTTNAFCNCADLINNGKVSFADYAKFAEWWIGL